MFLKIEAGRGRGNLFYEFQFVSHHERASCRKVNHLTKRAAKHFFRRQRDNFLVISTYILLSEAGMF